MAILGVLLIRGVNMPRVLPEEMLLGNLRQVYPKGSRLYMPKEHVYHILKIATQQDFGDDVEAWKAWLANNELDYRRYLESKRPTGANWRLKNANSQDI